MAYQVITDTSGNLPTNMLEKNRISVIPFSYFIDGCEYQQLDTAKFDAESYYSRIKSGLRVTTTQIAPQRYREVFEPIVQQGDDVLFVSMSSGISGSCNSARLAAAELMEDYPDRRVEVIDTLGASLGEGLVALRAARLRDLGESLHDAVGKLRTLSNRMFNVFTVDDLMHLRRGGRLSNLSAAVGVVLNIKPILKGNENGSVVSFAKLRGRKHSIHALANWYDKLAIHPEEQTVGIAQAGCREDAAYLADLLRKNRPPKEILTVEYEPVTGSYVGPGALALFFESEDGVRYVS